jgi:hypothetical protein
MPIIPALLKSKFEIQEDQLNKLDELDRQIDEQFRQATAGEGGATTAMKEEEAKVVA